MDELRTVRLLRLSALAYIEAFGGIASMSDTLAHLQKLSRSDASISRALASLLSEKRLLLTAERNYVLVIATNEPGEPS